MVCVYLLPALAEDEDESDPSKSIFLVASILQTSDASLYPSCMTSIDTSRISSAVYLFTERTTTTLRHPFPPFKYQLPPYLFIFRLILFPRARVVTPPTMPEHYITSSAVPHRFEATRQLQPHQPMFQLLVPPSIENSSSGQIVLRSHLEHRSRSWANISVRDSQRAV